MLATEKTEAKELQDGDQPEQLSKALYQNKI